MSNSRGCYHMSSNYESPSDFDNKVEKAKEALMLAETEYLQKSIQEAKDGELVDLGSFAKHVDDKNENSYIKGLGDFVAEGMKDTINPGDFYNDGSPTPRDISNQVLYTGYKEGSPNTVPSSILVSDGSSANPKDRVGSKKVNLSLVPPVANIYEAKVMELGAKKYNAYNWRDTPVKLSVYLSAILRHYSALADGQEFDPESGLPHIAHIRANTGILLDAREQGTLIDDRKTAGKAAEVLLKVEKK